jgi:hypothetical protein
VAKECAECPAGSNDHDDEGYCSVCKLRPLERRFPAEFREWIANLERLYLWVKAGYPLQANDLEWEAWQGLAMITRWHEVKDLEALTRGQQAV